MVRANPKDWDVWVKSSHQKQVPGAKDFCNMRIKNGVQITTTLTVQHSQVDDTIKNLEKEGIPVQDVTTSCS